MPAPYVQACDEGKGEPEACTELGLQLLRPGKFAERLAYPGDDFRQRHTWRERAAVGVSRTALKR